MTAPVEHVQEALKLEADKPIDLWEITLKTHPVVLYLRHGPTTSYQGRTYEGWGLELSGEGENATGETNRPKLKIFNPESLLSPFAAAKKLDLAVVVRKRVLQDHLLADIGIYQRRLWIIGRVTRVSRNGMEVELRSSHDIPAFQIPTRQFMPPDFPFVRY